MNKNRQKSLTLAETMKKNRQQPIIKSAMGQFFVELAIYAIVFFLYYFWMSGTGDGIYRSIVEIILIIGIPIVLVKLVYRLQKERQEDR